MRRYNTTSFLIGYKDCLARQTSRWPRCAPTSNAKMPGVALVDGVRFSLPGQQRVGARCLEDAAMGGRNGWSKKAPSILGGLRGHFSKGISGIRRTYSTLKPHRNGQPTASECCV